MWGDWAMRLKAFLLRIYWDEEKSRRWMMPRGDFVGLVLAATTLFTTAPLACELPHRALNSFFPSSFSETACTDHVDQLGSERIAELYLQHC